MVGVMLGVCAGHLTIEEEPYKKIHLSNWEEVANFGIDNEQLGYCIMDGMATLLLHAHMRRREL